MISGCVCDEAEQIPFCDDLRWPAAYPRHTASVSQVDRPLTHCQIQFDSRTGRVLDVSADLWPELDPPTNHG
jgi:hypothetical protein